MFTVLNSYRDNDNQVYYAVKDFSTSSDIEVITESELKLLVKLSMKLTDQTGKLIKIENDSLVCNVEDITDQLLGVDETDSEIDDFFSSYEEDEEETIEEFEESDDIDDFFSAYEEITEEDEDPEGSVVSKLYEHLTEEQIKVLKRYYLWYSQRLFNDAQKDPTFGLKNTKKIQAKKNILNNLRGNGDWRYAGFLDTGSKNSGYTCTLGHPLRYMHLAWDITVGDIETCFFGEDYNIDFEDVINSNNCIVYGIKCIGDFFEVDPECIRNLQRAQRESLKDMALMYDFYEEDRVQEVIDTFKLLDEIVRIISKKDVKGKMVKQGYIPTIPFSVASFYTQFRENNMIPPKSLVQTIRSCMLGWTNGETYFNNKWTGELKYPTEYLYKTVLPVVLKLKGVDKTLCDNLDYRHVSYGYCYSLEDAFLHYTYVMFAYECCGIYKYDAENNKDEGGKSKPVKARLALHYGYDSSRIFEDIEYSLDCLYKLLKLSSMTNTFENSYSNRNYELNIIPKGCESSIVCYLCKPNETVALEALAEFDRSFGNNLYKILDFMISISQSVNRPNRKRYDKYSSEFYNSNTTQLNLSQVYSIVSEKYTEFRMLFEKFQSFIDELNSKRLAEYKTKEEEKRLEREKREAERVRQEEITENEKEVSIIDTPKKLVDYLNEKKVSLIDTPKKMVDYLNENKDSLTGSNWDLPKNILTTVLKSGKEPSDRQMYHLKKMFKQLSGVDYSGVSGDMGDKVELSSRQDIIDAINFIFNNINLLQDCCDNLQGTTVEPDKFKNILESIVKYGKISVRQMRYAQAALKVYENNK